MLSLLVVATPEKCETLVFSLSHKTPLSEYFPFFHYEAIEGLHSWDMNIKFPSIFDQDWGVFFRAGVDWIFLDGSGSGNVSGVLTTQH